MYFLGLLFMLSLFASVFAQGSQESRITEHNVVSIIALAGLLTISYFVRKRRKLRSDNE